MRPRDATQICRNIFGHLIYMYRMRVRSVFSYRWSNYFCDQIYDAIFTTSVAAKMPDLFAVINHDPSFSGQNMVPLQIVRLSNKMELAFKLSFDASFARAGADADGIERLSISECKIIDLSYISDNNLSNSEFILKILGMYLNSIFQKKSV